MGSGFSAKCPHCDYSAEFSVGIGMRFPEVYREVLSDVLSGKYGAEWQSTLKETREAAIHAGTELFRCPRCNALESKINLSIYVREDGMPAKDYWAYWAEPGFKLLKSFPHKCPNCSETMERVGEDEEIEKAELTCPKCGAKLVVEHTVSWD